MIQPRGFLAWSCALALLAGCHDAKQPNTRRLPAATSAVDAALKATRTVPQLGEAVTLTGKVKLISNNGGAIISDNGSSIISNNAGAIVANNSSGLLAVSTAKPEWLLADAAITVADASGATLVDAAGKPLTAVSDGKGSYRLSAVLPAENLVLRVKLWNGGELAAILGRSDARLREQSIGTATSLGARYVLDKFVQGNQAVFNKLPAGEAEALTGALEQARGLLERVPGYDAAELVALTEQLRQRDTAVDRKLEDIKALLVGQVNLGNGRPAEQVPLMAVRGLAVQPDGALVLGESTVGRIRRVGTDGLVYTRLDTYHGEVKRNFREIEDVAAAPNGDLYVASKGAARIYRLAVDGTIEVLAGNGIYRRGAVGEAANRSSIVALSVTVATDGKVYFGENEGWGSDDGTPTRLLTVNAEGKLEAVVVDPTWGPGSVGGLAPLPDGGLAVLYSSDKASGTLYRLKPGQRGERLAEGLLTDDDSDVAATSDGTIYVSEPQLGRLTAIRPDGKREEIGWEAGSGPRIPSNLAAAGDTLYVADLGESRVWARGADGRWQARAGVDPATRGGKLNELAVNSPAGIAFDQAGALLTAEAGSHTIKRFDGRSLELVAGTSQGFAGDGGPAAAAKFSIPSGVAYRDGRTWVLDRGNRRLRLIDRDGTVSTVVGKEGGTGAKNQDIRDGLWLVLDPAGRPVWCDANRHKVERLEDDGQVTLLAGGENLPVPAAEGSSPLKTSPVLAAACAFDAEGSLYISDTIGGRIYKVTRPGEPDALIAPWAGVDMGTALQRMDGGLPAEEGKPRLDATLVGPSCLSFDQAGNLYVGEMGINGMAMLAPADPESGMADMLDALPQLPARIRKIAPDGSVTTVAGEHGKFFTDPGGDDALVLPYGIALTPDGRLAIVDTGANVIRFLPAGSF